MKPTGDFNMERLAWDREFRLSRRHLHITVKVAKYVLALNRKRPQPVQSSA
jgi:hypothetical protein